MSVFQMSGKQDKVVGQIIIQIFAETDIVLIQPERESFRC